MAEVKTQFRPSRHRIDEIVLFHALDEKHIKDIAKIQLRYLEARLAKLEIGLEVADSALARSPSGFDHIYGARPVKRAIQQSIGNPLAKQILEGLLRGTPCASNSRAARCDSRNPARESSRRPQRAKIRDVHRGRQAPHPRRRRKIADTAVAKARQAGIAISVVVADSAGTSSSSSVWTAGASTPSTPRPPRPCAPPRTNDRLPRTARKGQELDASHALGLALAAGPERWTAMEAGARSSSPVNASGASA